MFLRRKQSGRLIGRTSSRSVFNGTLVILLSLCILLGLFGWKNASAEDYVCGLEEHTHTSDCYENTLICEDTEHEHTDECYEQTLVCDQTEHKHSDECLIAAETEDTVEEQDEVAEENEIMALAADEDSGIEAYASNISTKANVIEGTTPSNTVINLFDYWPLTDTDQPDEDPPAPTTPVRGPNYYAGINQRVDNVDYDTHSINNYYSQFDRPLVFEFRTGFTFLGTANGYKADPTQGIVENTLGSNGYPILKWNGDTSSDSETSSYWPHNINGMTSGTYNGQTEETADFTYGMFQENNSLAYLFDTSSVKGDKADGTYTAGKLAFTNVDGLFQVDENGNYYYNCTQNYAQFDEEDNKFILYDEPVGYGDLTGQFFPFASYDTAKAAGDQKDRKLNHYFGLSMTTRFIQNYGGYTSSAKNNAMIFDFSGDDDVWIFIDDVLVADLGGIHDKAGVKIDFSTGRITYTSTNNSLQSTTIYDQFVAAKAVDSTKWTTTGGNTIFADDTSHTLKFFYMERGDNQSNMILTTNLSTVPETSINKVDQNGISMSGVKLAAYTAKLTSSDSTTDQTNSSQYRYVVDPVDGDSGRVLVEPSTITSKMVNSSTGVITLDNGRTITPKLTGVTDDDGSWILVNDSGAPYTTNDLRNNVFGSDEIIVREIDVPDGYRTVSDNILLYFDQGDHLTTPNSYESGVWPSPNVVVTASNTLYPTDWSTTNDNSIKYYTYDSTDQQWKTDGTLFAVVLKRNGASLENFEDTWYPIYGNETSGYTVQDSPGLSSVLDAYQKNIKKQYSDPTFTQTATGMQVLLTDLPGSLSRYYTYMKEHDIQMTDTDPQYAVAYFYSKLSQVDLLKLDPSQAADNIVRVASHADVSYAPNDYSGFMTNWSATIEITNIEDRLYYQKTDEQGNFVNGATFALYNAGEDSNGDVYLIATDGSDVYLGKDPDGDNEGTAKVNGTTYSYSIDGETGKITIGEGDFTVIPSTNADGTSLTGVTTSEEVNTYEDGTGRFDRLKDGNYILREISAPEGYLLNTELIKVLVNEDGVYANAGTADDGVIVGNGAGFLIPTFNDSASHGDIDETLTWIYSLLRVNTTNNSYDALNSLNVLYAPVKGTISTAEQTAGWLYASTDNASNGLSTSAPTASRPSAMVTYLEYADTVDEDTHSLFDYMVNSYMVEENGESVDIGQSARKASDNAYPTTEGQGTLRLYTDVGWSELSILQDYEWGSTHRSVVGDNASNSTTYTNLTNQNVYGQTGVNMNLAHLFSNSTFVRVADPRPVNIELNKVDSSENSLSGAEFILYQQIGMGEDGNPVNQYYSYNSGTTSWVDAQDSATSLVFNGQKQTVYHLTDGTYYLKETKAPSGYIIETEPWKMILTDTALTDEDKTSNPTAIGKTTISLFKPESTDVSQTATVYILSDGTNITYSQSATDLIKLVNTKIYNLPSSGSFGVLPFILTGSLILGFSVYLLMKEERQSAS